MTRKKHALLLFCKPPVPGFVKTRLTEEHGGSLTPEEAAQFFACSLLDVAEVAMLALDDLDAYHMEQAVSDPGYPATVYDFYISTVSVEAFAFFEELFKEEGPWSREISYIVDKGASFDEHFDDAFNQLFSKGYESVVAIGGDMPLLPREHITKAFLLLEHLASQNEEGHAFVQAPCQQSGVSLVGLTQATPLTAGGVYYNRTGLAALDAYTNKLNETEIPNAYLAPVADVDNDNDLAHTISCLNAIAAASFFQEDLFVARRVLEWIDEMGLMTIAPPNDEHDPRDYLDTAV